MAAPLMPGNEQERLDALRSYQILDSASEKDFDDLSKLASVICQTPIALISFVDKDRQWFKSHLGLPICETDKAYSFCVHTIASPQQMMVIEDAREDLRFADNPFVTGEPHVVFYVGVPLINEQGYALGSLCVIGHEPKQLTDAQREALQTLASQVMDKLELRRKNLELTVAYKHIEKLNQEITVGKQRLHTILDTMADGVGITDTTGRVIYSNQRAREILKVTESEFAARTSHGPAWHNEHLNGTPMRQEEHPVSMALQSGAPVLNQEFILCPPGEERTFVLMNAVPLLNEAGTEGVVVTFTDVTQQRKLTQRLMEGESRFRALIEQAPVAIMVLRGSDMVFEIVNQAMMELLGKTGDLTGKPMLEVLPELKGQRPWDIMRNVFRTGEHYQADEISAILMRNGKQETCYFNVSYSPLYENERLTGILEVATDVTAQVLARKAMEQAEETLRQAVSSTNMGTWSADLLTRVLVFSERTQHMHGFDHLTNPSLSEALEVVNPEYRDGLKRVVRQAITSGSSFHHEYLISPLHAFKPRWLRITGKPEYNAQHQAISISGTVLDITEQKELDQRKDDFISIASHELKTPVTSLKAALQVIERLKQTPSSPVFERMITQANRSMQKVSQLIEDLLNASRMNEGQMPFNNSAFHLLDLMQESVAAFDQKSGPQITIEGKGNLAVYADRHRIEQVIVNLLSNALKYAPGSDHILLKAEQLNGMVKVSVADQGNGIASEKLPHLFDRYYRAEESNHQTTGLGLGLYICAEIIRRNGGQIGVESELGEGSTFWFMLPTAVTATADK